MSGPGHSPFKRQPSKSNLEHTIGMIPPPQQGPITIYPGPSRNMANLSKADLEIAQRLESLRRSGAEQLPTEEEMASRLAQLKGLPSDHYSRAPATNAVFPRPDQRTASEKAQDLLAQAMEEVSIDARMASVDDELEARLARLRGVERSVPPAGAVALPPEAHRAQAQPRVDPLLDDDIADMDLDEVEALMQASAREGNEAAARALGGLEADQELAHAVALASKRREKKGKKKARGARGAGGGSSDDERKSNSYDSDLDIEGGKAIDAVRDQEEVQRIIDMYTKRAQLKKERKRKRREAAGGAAGGAGAVGGEDSDSDIESGSNSSLTSESEKFSESDELSD